MNITKGKQTRAQRVVIYGVESVGKSTFAAQFPAPLFLDVEGGTAHLDTARAEIDSWKQLNDAVSECAHLDYKTVIIDSADWAERLAIADLLAQHKKGSIEDFGFGKGWVMVSEKIAGFLSRLDSLIVAGKNVALIAHSKVTKVEPPDLPAAYDRYELKLSKQSSPLVKEWADELWFFRFKTKTVESESGRAKGIGGKERIILTTHSAAYDAKTRSGLPEELPMTWASVAHLFNAPAPKPAPAVEIVDSETVTLEDRLAKNEEKVNSYLLSKNLIAEGQTFRNMEERVFARIKANPEKFFAAIP
jgi:hypothetical protein